jgi:hypothetical protein
VRSIAWLGIIRTIGTVSFYWGPPRHFRYPVIWLGVSHCWYAALGAAGEVAGNSAVTELFPTALRSTIIGWLTLVIAFAAIASQMTIATLAGPLGGLSVVVGYLALLQIPARDNLGCFHGRNARHDARSGRPRGRRCGGRRPN